MGGGCFDQRNVDRSMVTRSGHSRTRLIALNKTDPDRRMHWQTPTTKWKLDVRTKKGSLDSNYLSTSRPEYELTFRFKDIRQEKRFQEHYGMTPSSTSDNSPDYSELTPLCG